MPRRRFTERFPLPAAPPQQQDTILQQQRRDINAQRINQFPIENESRQAQIDRANAAEAKARYELSKQIETDRQRTAFYNGLQELETHLNNNGAPIGTRQHAEAFSAYAHEFPLARSSADVQKALKIHALVNDDQAALKGRMQQSIDAGKALGLQPKSASFIKGGNVDVQFENPALNTEGSDPEAELFKSHGVTKVQFLNPLNAKQGVVDDKGNFSTNFAPGQVATAIQFQAGNAKNAPATQLTHVMPLSEFNTYRQGFGQDPLPAVQYSGPTPTATPTPQPSTTTPIYTPAPVETPPSVTPQTTATVPPLADIFADQPQNP